MLHAALASLLLLRLHPRPLAHTPSFQFSTSFMGVRPTAQRGKAQRSTDSATPSACSCLRTYPARWHICWHAMWAGHRAPHAADRARRSRCCQQACLPACVQAMFGMVAGVAWMSPHAHQPGVQVCGRRAGEARGPGVGVVEQLLACARNRGACTAGGPTARDSPPRAGLLPLLLSRSCSAIACALQLEQLWSGGRLLLGSRALWAARRLALGFATVGALKEASRAAFKAALPFLYRFFPLPIRRLWQPPVHNLYKPAQEAAAAAAAGKAARAAQQEAPDAFQQEQDMSQQEQQQGMELATANGHSARRRRGAQHNGSAGPKGSGACGDQTPGTDARLLAALPHNEAGLPWDVDVTSRFFAYAGIGLAVAGVSPRAFEALGW